MNALVILCALASQRGTVNMRGMLGEWHGWKIAEASWSVKPPRKTQRKLVLFPNGSFTLRDETSIKGTYSVRGEKIKLKGYGETYVATYVFRDHLIWDIPMATGSEYVFARPGRRVKVPTSRDGNYILPRYFP